MSKPVGEKSTGIYCPHGGLITFTSDVIGVTFSDKPITKTSIGVVVGCTNTLLPPYVPCKTVILTACIGAFGSVSTLTGSSQILTEDDLALMLTDTGFILTYAAIINTILGIDIK